MDVTKLKQGQVVWVKLKGYSWWPGIVNKYNITIIIDT